MCTIAESHTQTGTDRSITASQQFDSLFLQYEKGIFNLIFRMVGDHEDAVDLTSQTFLHALRGFERFRGDAQTYTWLYRIAVNLCKNHFRKRDREARFQMLSLDSPINADDEGFARDIHDTTHSPERALEGHELQAHLQRAIMQLSTDLRTVILLRDVQGLSYQEIADITGCSVEAVKSRIFRARGFLRRELAPHLHPEAARQDGAAPAAQEAQ